MYTRKGVIFDLDGTLLDTIGDIADSMNEVLLSHGFPPHERHSYRAFVGGGMDILVRRALPENRRNEQTISELVSSMKDEYAGRWRNTSRPYPGVSELLEALTDKGIAFSVLSNKIESFTLDMVQALLGSWRFSQVRGLVFGSPRKPDPSAALEIARDMGLDPGQMAFVGDSDIDIETGQRAGMLPVGVLWGYQDRSRLAAKGVDILLENPMDLLRYL